MNSPFMSNRVVFLKTTTNLPVKFYLGFQTAIPTVRTVPQDLSSELPGGVIFYFSGLLLNLKCFRSQEEEYQCNEVIQLPAWVPTTEPGTGVARSNVSNEKTETVNGDAGPKVNVVNYVVNEDGDYLFAIMVKKEDQNTQDFEANIKVEFKSKSK